MRKYISLVVGLTALAFVLAACTRQSPPISTDNYTMVENQNAGVMNLRRDGIVYEFYGAVGNSLLSEQIGIVDGDPLAHIYEVKGFSSDEWVIEYYDVMMSTYSLWKSKDVTEVPPDIQDLLTP